MDVRHLLIVRVLLIVDLQNERITRLLQPLHEFEVHQVEAQRVSTYHHLMLLLGLINPLLLDIVVTRIFGFLVDYKDILL